MPTSCLLATSHQTKLNIEIPVQLRRIPGQTNVVYSCSMMQAMWNYMATNVFIIDISYHATGSKTRFSKASSQYQCYLTPQTTSNISRYWRGVAACYWSTVHSRLIAFYLPCLLLEHRQSFLQSLDWQLERLFHLLSSRIHY